MRRREFMTLLGGAAIAWSRDGLAQTSTKVYRLGSLDPARPLSANSPDATTLLAALAARGYTLGQNLAYDARASGGDNSKLPDVLQDFKASGVDVILTIGYQATLASKTAGIATVAAAGVGDPVATGLVKSLAQPGGFVTGISDDATALSTKRLSLLKEMLPHLRRVAMLWNAGDLAMSLRYEASAAAARSIGVTVQPLGVREPDDFAKAFETMDREPPDAILMMSDTLAVLNRKSVFDYAAAKRLPAIYESEPYVRAGGLMSYGGDRKESFQRAAALVDRIFKGARPADLPFEQPTRYVFVINLGVAKAIGLEIPPNLLALADEVIE
jgi:putative tryptophan/tyrosine transport system substrate-binding protein